MLKKPLPEDLSKELDRDGLKPDGEVSKENGDQMEISSEDTVNEESAESRDAMDDTPRRPIGVEPVTPMKRRFEEDSVTDHECQGWHRPANSGRARSSTKSSKTSAG